MLPALDYSLISSPLQILQIKRQDKNKNNQTRKFSSFYLPSRFMPPMLLLLLLLSSAVFNSGFFSSKSTTAAERRFDRDR